MKNELTLEKVCENLFDIFEEEDVRDKRGRTNEYFRQKVMQDEMEGKYVDNGYYAHLADIVKRDVLPLYDKFTEERHKILEKNGKRKMWKYVVGTVAAMEVIEAIASRGFSLMPMFIVRTAPIEAGVGAAWYGLAHVWDRLNIREAQNKFWKRVDSMDKALRTEKKYDAYQEVNDGEILRGEAFDLLSQYEDTDKFWEDYEAVRAADPKTEAEFNKLYVPAFSEFLSMHINGVHTDEMRQKRFNELFIEAHKYFTDKNKDEYIHKNLHRYE